MIKNYDNVRATANGWTKPRVVAGLVQRQSTTGPQQRSILQGHVRRNIRHTIARIFVRSVDNSHFIPNVVDSSGHRNEAAKIDLVVVAPIAAGDDAERANVGVGSHLEVEGEHLHYERGSRG